jgi:hypothetical protein
MLRVFCTAVAIGNDPLLPDEACKLHADRAERVLVRMARTPAADIAGVWAKIRASDLDSCDVGQSRTGAALWKSAIADLTRLAGIDPNDYPASPLRDRTPARYRLESVVRAAIAERGLGWYRELLVQYGVATSAALTTKQLAAVVRRLDADSAKLAA